MPNENYVPYGEEWEKEMSKLTKYALIGIAANIGREKERLSAELSKLRSESLCKACGNHTADVCGECLDGMVQDTASAVMDSR